MFTTDVGYTCLILILSEFVSCTRRTNNYYHFYLHALLMISSRKAISRDSCVFSFCCPNNRKSENSLSNLLASSCTALLEIFASFPVQVLIFRSSWFNQRNFSERKKRENFLKTRQTVKFKR